MVKLYGVIYQAKPKDKLGDIRKNRKVWKKLGLIVWLNSNGLIVQFDK